MKKIIEKALENVAKLFASKRALGQQLGETAAILVRDYLVIAGVRKAVTHIKSLYVDRSGNINDQGNGTLIAAIYQTDDGGYYKEMDGKIYTWNGNSWV